MRKWRTVGVVLVTLATLIGGALGIPAHPAITRKAAVQDKQAS